MLVNDCTTRECRLEAMLKTSKELVQLVPCVLVYWSLSMFKFWFFFAYVIMTARLLHVDWMARLKTSNELVQLVPRVLFDSWTKSDYLELFSNSVNTASLGKSMAQQLKVGNLCCFLLLVLGHEK